jgi:hypothetical protein
MTAPTHRVPADAPLSTVEDLLRAMTILGVPGDPLLIMRDHSEERRRVELSAHLAAALVARLGRLEAQAGLDVDDRTDLYWHADRDVTAPAGRPRDLHLARLGWVHHAMVRDRERRADPVADTVSTTLGVLIRVLEGGVEEAIAAGRQGPVLADALRGLCAAADHLGTVLRSYPVSAI